MIEFTLVEVASIIFCIIYVLNFINGSLQNAAIVRALGTQHGVLLKQNFSSLNKAPSSEGQTVKFEKESQSEYRLFMSGRRYCQGVAIGIQLKRRHDLLSRFNKDHDLLTLEVVMRDKAMDPCTFAIFRKRHMKKFLSASPEILRYCRQVPLEFLPRKLVCFTDCDELVTHILNPHVVDTLVQSLPLFEALQLSDQHSTIVMGTVAQERKTIKCSFRLPKLKEIDRLGPLLELALILIDMVGTTRLSEYSKQKAVDARIQNAVTKKVYNARCRKIEKLAKKAGHLHMD